MTNNQNDSNIVAQLRRRLSGRQPSLINRSYIEASVLVAIKMDADQPSLILTRRASHLNIHPGEAAFPGGKKDLEDESLLHTALREANEEIGLSAAEFDYFGALDQCVTSTGIKVSPFVGLVSASAQLTPNLQELDCIYTVPIDFFLNANNLQSIEKLYKGGMRTVAHFNYQQHSIWGVTARIIIDLMNTAFDAGLSVE